MIREDNDVIYIAEIMREEEAHYYTKQADVLYKEDIMKQFNAINKK